MAERARTTDRTAGNFDVQAARRDFPILAREVHGKPLVYLDNAATSQKPQAVIDAVSRCYAEEYANIHRGVHFLSVRATQAFEDARDKVRRFIGAPDWREIVFVRGTTEAINLVAQTWGRQNLQPGDEIVISVMEHHSNIVPWQMLCQEKGLKLRVIPMSDQGELDLQGFEALLGPRTKLVSVAHVSNALGTINPVKKIIDRAHQVGARVLVDGAQAVPHLEVDVRDLDCDFYAFSGHKLYGPTGIGVLFGKADVLEAMPPYQGGGEMISSVTFEKTTYNEVPYKFEAGTQHIAGAIGLGAAIDYLVQLGRPAVEAHEAGLLTYGTRELQSIAGLRLVGTARQKAAVISFVLEGIHAHDLGTILDGEGIAVRAGNHCAQPALARLGLEATARASFALYTTREEIDRLVEGVKRVKEVLG
jgi:cysteine desulfurase/selenocysteine lyase